MDKKLQLGELKVVHVMTVMSRPSGSTVPREEIGQMKELKRCVDVDGPQHSKVVDVDVDDEEGKGHSVDR